jgi:hypothetical protein
LSKPEVLLTLEQLLESPQFRTSKKCSRFLRHIVEAALDHKLDCLKERTLGVDVFEREPHYDTNQDPIVRGTASEVRKRLAQYYQEAGQDDHYRFSLPAGSYVPEIHAAGGTEFTTVAQVHRTAHRPVTSPVPSKRSRWWLFTTAGVFTLAVAAVGVFLGGNRSPTEQFWGPLLNAKQSPVVCMGQPQIYTFRPDTVNALNSWFTNSPDHPAGPPPFASVPVDQIVPMWTETVSLSDANAFLRIANLFASKGKSMTLLGERGASLSDLRGRPAILIGAFDNAWTMNLTGELRYYFDQDPKSHEQVIRDRKSPAQSTWKLVDAWPPTKNIHTDYALVTRVVNPTTEATVVTLAGISQYGTQAAAEFVSTPNYLTRALTQAPRDWPHKNLQIVLSTTVMSDTSGPPQVVSANFW